MKDCEILQQLARQYMEYAALDVNNERRSRAYQTTALKQVRPLVWIDEEPWNEMNLCNELNLVCEGKEARQAEDWLRKKLFQWKYFQADMILEPFYPVHPCIINTHYGLEVTEQTRSVDISNHIVAHEYCDQLDRIEKLENIQMPTVTRDYAAEQKRLEILQELLGDSMPVKMVQEHAWYTCWDDIAKYRSMSNLLMDLACDPELMHATIEKISRCKAVEFEQMEKLNVFGCHLTDLHCTPHYSHELESIENEKGPGRHSTWLRANAQPFASVSPQMHDEFEMQYLLPLTGSFGFTYYGCCEPLSDRLDVITKIPNLRKIGVSPWSSVDASAEQIGGKYIYARKPNPAFVIGTIDEEAIRNETKQTIEACLRYGCPLEFVLKDISSVSYKPENLFKWVQIVEDTIDRYF